MPRESPQNLRLILLARKHSISRTKSEDKLTRIPNHFNRFRTLENDAPPSSTFPITCALLRKQPGGIPPSTDSNRIDVRNVQDRPRRNRPYFRSRSTQRRIADAPDT